METKTNIEVQGAILTPELLGELHDLQQHSNSNLMVYTDAVTNSICYIASQMASMDNGTELITAARIAAELSMVKQLLEKFKKP